MRRSFIISTLFLLFIEVSPVFATNIKINEFLAHPSLGNSEWVEFYNPDHLDLSSYWIDDDTSFTSDSGNSSKKSLSNLLNNNSDFPYVELRTFLNNPGDSIVLFANDGTIVDQYQYNSDPGIDQAIGRNPDGGDWMTLTGTSKGSSNNTNSSEQSSSDPSPTPTALLTPTPTSTTPVPTATPTIKTTPSPTPSPQTAAKAKTTKTPTPSPNQPTPAPSVQTIALSNIPIKSLAKVSYRSASVAAVSTTAATEKISTNPATVEVANSKQNYFIWIGIVLIFAGISSIGYIYFTKNGKVSIKLRDRY